MPHRLWAPLAGMAMLAGVGVGGATPVAARTTLPETALPETASVSVTVDQDTYLSEANPDTPHAAYTWLAACPRTCDATAGSERQSLVRFTVVGVPAGATGVTMRLRLRAARTTDSSISVSKVAATWADGVTWKNRPSLGTALDTAKGLTDGRDVELDVSDAFTGNGTYSFGIKATAGAQAVFDSAEAADGMPPRLIATYTAQRVAGPFRRTVRDIR
ncbi:DNRLRE domain-containing protein [Nonomuraea sp. NPDC049141]|uniref:CBM96 family carbohydrate-binding protein n=1 Tax=Nonomuraea sp. NPDC049141 TaxID=3155500 RepID=UPI0033EB6724